MCYKKELSDYLERGYEVVCQRRTRRFGKKYCINLKHSVCKKLVSYYTNEPIANMHVYA